MEHTQFGKRARRSRCSPPWPSGRPARGAAVRRGHFDAVALRAKRAPSWLRSRQGPCGLWRRTARIALRVRRDRRYRRRRPEVRDQAGWPEHPITSSAILRLPDGGGERRGQSARRPDVGAPIRRSAKSIDEIKDGMRIAAGVGAPSVRAGMSAAGPASRWIWRSPPTPTSSSSSSGSTIGVNADARESRRPQHRKPGHAHLDYEGD